MAVVVTASVTVRVPGGGVIVAVEVTEIRSMTVLTTVTVLGVLVIVLVLVFVAQVLCVVEARMHWHPFNTCSNERPQTGDAHRVL